jgi:hypothetical protein
MCNSGMCRHTIATLNVLILLTALAGAWGLIAQHGMGMSAESLTGTPFASFVIPGLILGLVIGGTNLISSLLILRRSRFSAEASAVAGFGLLIWIFAQTYILHLRSWMQPLFFGLGLLILILTLVEVKYASH